MGERNKIILSGIVGLVIGLLIGQATWSKELTPNWPDDKERLIGLTPTNKLENKSDEEFEKELLRALILNHEGAIEISRLILSRSKQGELTNFAEQLITKQTDELNRMKKWLTNQFSNDR